MNWFSYRLKKSPLFRLFVFGLIIFLLVLGLRFVSSRINRKPEIISMFPTVVSDYDTVTITGLNFGSSESGNGLRLGDDFFPASQCLSWEEEKIVFTVPKNFSTTLVSVTDGAELSKKLVLTQRKDIPEILEHELPTTRPEIASLNRSNGSVGQTITIKGAHFGNTRQNSQVIFTELSDVFLGDGNVSNLSIEGAFCLDEDLDFISWSDSEIVVHVPDGASSGNILVQTAVGFSNTVPFTVSTRVGKKTISNKRTITLSLSASLGDFSLRSRQNSLFLYFAKPIASYMQQNQQLLSTDSTVFASAFKGSSIYKFENLTETSRISVTETISVETHDVQVKVDANAVSANLRLKTEMKQYTNATDHIQADNPAVKNLASTIIGRTTNPYTNARKIYNYILEEITALSRVSQQERSISEIIEQKTADAYEISLLYCTLLRAVNIPCVQVAGIAIDDNRNAQTHWWNEFYLDEVGWIPVDAAMAMGVPFKREGTSDAYFASLDGLHIAFSKDTQAQTQMLSGSLVVNKAKSYCVRQIWEESVGLVGYNALWLTPKVISVY